MCHGLLRRIGKVFVALAAGWSALIGTLRAGSSLCTRHFECPVAARASLAWASVSIENYRGEFTHFEAKVLCRNDAAVEQDTRNGRLQRKIRAQGRRHPYSTNVINANYSGWLLP